MNDGLISFLSTVLFVLVILSVGVALFDPMDWRKNNKRKW